MNNIKTEFTIKDLENFSGIKAHTIRIWEKRYKLLTPNRTDSNIRYYDLENLQKLLNVNLLYINGLKISKIAKLSSKDLNDKVKELLLSNGIESHALNSFKLAMLNFDENLFNQTYNGLLASMSFRELFKTIFIPFLKDIGILWQVNSITPAHEHFVSNLIQQKIQINIERLQQTITSKSDYVFVLFLPLNEIHELGLLYLHFELNFHGYKTIYLGRSVPTESLTDLLKFYEQINFVTYLTVEPSNITLENYLGEVYLNILVNSKNKLLVLGAKVSDKQVDTKYLDCISFFNSPFELLNKI